MFNLSIFSSSSSFSFVFFCNILDSFDYYSPKIYCVYNECNFYFLIMSSTIFYLEDYILSLQEFIWLSNFQLFLIWYILTKLLQIGFYFSYDSLEIFNYGLIWIKYILHLIFFFVIKLYLYIFGITIFIKWFVKDFTLFMTIIYFI